METQIPIEDCLSKLHVSTLYETSFLDTYVLELCISAVLRENNVNSPKCQSYHVQSSKKSALYILNVSHLFVQIHYKSKLFLILGN